MKLRKLELTNWCQHESLTMDIANGLTGIVGPNGKGKSNIIRALVYALTGLYSGRREDYLRYGADKGSVAMEFLSESDSTLYRVERNVHNGKVWIYRFNNGAFELISDRSATAREILDGVAPVSQDVANQVYAVPQEDMVSLLRETPSRRMEIMQRTFSLQFFERMKKKIRAIVTQADTLGTELQARLLLLQDQASAKRTYLAEHANLPARAALNSTVESLTKELEEVNRKIGEFALRDYLTKQIAELGNRIQSLEQTASEERPVSTFAMTSSQIREDLQDCKERMDKLKKARSAFTLVEQYSVLPECPPDEVVARIKGELDNSVYSVQKARDTYNHIVKCGTNGTCPTCGAPVQFTEADLVRAQTEYSRSMDVNKALHAELSQCEEAIAARKKAEAYLANLQDKARDAWNDLNLGTMCVETAECIARINQAIDEEADKYRVMSENQDAVLRYESAVRDWESRVLSAKKSLEESQANLQVMKANPIWTTDLRDSTLPDLHSRKDTITKDLQKYRDMQMLRIQYDSVSLELEGLTQDIAIVSRQLEETDPKLRERLWELHALYQSRELPAKVAFAIYRVLAEKLNLYLSEFEAPYKVELHENGDFICIFNSGLQQQSSRLSGGEKMLLAIAFRLALHSVFSNDDTGGFIMLDEPTTFLDTRNRDGLFRVLNTLKTSPVFRDLQIIIVTHDDMLKPLFDSVVDLTGR